MYAPNHGENRFVWHMRHDTKTDSRILSTMVMVMMTLIKMCVRRQQIFDNESEIRNVIVNEIPETPRRLEEFIECHFYDVCAMRVLYIVPLNCLIFSSTQTIRLNQFHVVNVRTPHTQPMCWFLMWNWIEAAAASSAVNNTDACLRIDWDANLASSNDQCE